MERDFEFPAYCWIISLGMNSMLERLSLSHCFLHFHYFELSFPWFWVSFSFLEHPSFPLLLLPRSVCSTLVWNTKRTEWLEELWSFRPRSFINPLPPRNNTPDLKLHFLFPRNWFQILPTLPGRLRIEFHFRSELMFLDLKESLTWSFFSL